MTKSRFENLLIFWKFFLLLVLLQFLLMPVAMKGYNLRMILPDFRLHYLLDSGVVLVFCPMTPVFLTLLILSIRSVSWVVSRVTAMVGEVIGCYNMGNLATDTRFYLGLYHLPLLGDIPICFVE